LPLIGAILIPRYTTACSDFAEEPAREVFAAVTMIRNIGVLCRKRKPNKLCRVAETRGFGARARYCAWVLGHGIALPCPHLGRLRLNRGELSMPRYAEKYAYCQTQSTDLPTRESMGYKSLMLYDYKSLMLRHYKYLMSVF
jgi:hypothetical protein